MRKASGFTFIEVIVSVVIFGIVMLFGLSFFSYGMQPLYRAKEKVYALTLAQDAIENVRASCVDLTTYNTIPPGPTIKVFNHPDITNVPFTQTTGVSVANGYRIVVTTVSWHPNHDPAQSDQVVFRTYVAQPLQ